MVKLFIASSLDGFIAGPNEEIDWLFDDDDYGYSDFMADIDAVVMGRKSYELCLGFGSWPYMNIPTYVMSGSLEQSKISTVSITDSSPSKLMDKLGNKNVWLMGGGELIASFRKQHLIDEYLIAVHPILLGNGIPLFPGQLPQEVLTLESTKTYPSGLVTLKYYRKDP